MSLDAWLKSGKYLPPVLRDFHDQKDVFKAMHEVQRPDPQGGTLQHAYDVDWIAGQCYVIDRFLWFMARRGYTLQRSRKKLDYVDLHETVRKCEEQRSASFEKALAPTPIQDKS